MGDPPTSDTSTPPVGTCDTVKVEPAPGAVVKLLITSVDPPLVTVSVAPERVALAPLA